MDNYAEIIFTCTAGTESEARLNNVKARLGSAAAAVLPPNSGNSQNTRAGRCPRRFFNEAIQHELCELAPI
jgi:hypothetical protein